MTFALGAVPRRSETRGEPGVAESEYGLDGGRGAHAADAVYRLLEERRIVFGHVEAPVGVGEPVGGRRPVWAEQGDDEADAARDAERHAAQQRQRTERATLGLLADVVDAALARRRIGETVD